MVIHSYTASKTALSEATSKDQIDKVNMLLDDGADINEKFHYDDDDDDDDDYEYTDTVDIHNKYTALMVAVIKKLPKMVNLLLTKGADVNAQDIHGYTPLMLLSSNNYDNISGYVAGNKIKLDVKICKRLLQQDDIDIDIKNVSGQTALDIAKLYNYDEIVELLQQYPIRRQDKKNVDLLIKEKPVYKPYGKQRLHHRFGDLIKEYLGGKTKIKGTFSSIKIPPLSKKTKTKRTMRRQIKGGLMCGAQPPAFVQKHHIIYFHRVNGRYGKDRFYYIKTCE